MEKRDILPACRGFVIAVNRLRRFRVGQSVSAHKLEFLANLKISVFHPLHFSLCRFHGHSFVFIEKSEHKRRPHLVNPAIPKVIISVPGFPDAAFLPGFRVTDYFPPLGLAMRLKGFREVGR